MLIPYSESQSFIAKQVILYRFALSDFQIGYVKTNHNNHTLTGCLYCSLSIFNVFYLKSKT